MAAFLIDEDLPRSTAAALRRAGHAVADVRDVGLRGRSDAEVYAYAQAHGLTLVTADMGFANILRFPLGTHAGIVVLRVPNELAIDQLNRLLVNALADLSAEALRGALVIAEMTRTRIRRRPGERS